MPRCITNLAQVEKRRGILRRQLDVLMFSNLVIKCGKCQRRGVPVCLAYKCFYCGIWFCGKCAAIHFR